MIWQLISTICIIVGQVSAFIDDDARLINATTNSTSSAPLDKGIVEIYHSGQWYPLCALFWTFADANVTCRSIGFENGASNLTSLNQTSDEYYMRYSGFECNGNETTLRNCKHETPPVITNVSCSSGAAVAFCIQNVSTQINYAMIFGITGGCVAFVALSAGVGYFVYRWKLKKRETNYRIMTNSML